MSWNTTVLLFLALGHGVLSYVNVFRRKKEMKTTKAQARKRSMPVWQLLFLRFWFVNVIKRREKKIRLGQRLTGLHASFLSHVSTGSSCVTPHREVRNEHYACQLLCCTWHFYMVGDRTPPDPSFHLHGGLRQSATRLRLKIKTVCRTGLIK